MLHPIQFLRQRVFTKSHSRRRNHRRQCLQTVEVCESRVMLSGSDVLSVQIAGPHSTFLNDYDFVQATDADTRENPDFDFSLWNATNGQNRVMNISNPFNPYYSNSVSPELVDENVYSQMVRGALGDATDVDGWFFWNPQTGENFASIFTSGIFENATNYIAPAAINGNEFQNIVVGDFSDAPGEELFFWDQISGKNRLVSPATGVIQTNLINPTAINGEFKVVRTGNFDGMGTDDLFFWDPASGKNRLVTFSQSMAEGPVATAEITTNFIADVAINGNAYSQLIVSDYDLNGRSDLFFWNPQSGQNRLALVDETDGSVAIETNCIEPLAINGNDFSMAVAFYTYMSPFSGEGPYTPTIMFVDPITGGSRRFSTPISE